MNEKDLEDALKRLNQLRMLHLAQCREDVQRIIDNKNTDENQEEVVEEETQEAI